MNEEKTFDFETVTVQAATAEQLGSKESPFSSYRAYISRLEKLLKALERGPDEDRKIVAALDGQASLELQQIASVEARQKYGTYFTGTKLSKRLLLKLMPARSNRFFYDPTCGMGNLLIAAARQLPLGTTLPATLKQWGHQLAGTDLHEEFIRGTKIRLMLLARQRHRLTSALTNPPDNFFPHIRVANGLEETTEFERSNTLLMNPPYGVVDSPKGCTWAGGRVSESAIFMVSALERSAPGTEVLAILPDVLRSGSFSERWRDRISELAEIHVIKPCGVFDESADVDVFLLQLVRRTQKRGRLTKQWPKRRTLRHTTVGTFFEVHVGRVVPHRDPLVGDEHPYIHPRSVPPWTIMTEFAERRRHPGTVYHPPFVAIRRTSRPGHPYRATATVISGETPVAVENHLIVCKPKDGQFATCETLMKALKTDAVNTHLNTRICCRHLTVNAVSEIPLSLTQ